MRCLRRRPKPTAFCERQRRRAELLIGRCEGSTIGVVCQAACSIGVRKSTWGRGGDSKKGGARPQGEISPDGSETHLWLCVADVINDMICIFIIYGVCGAYFVHELCIIRVWYEFYSAVICRHQVKNELGYLHSILTNIVS